MLSTHLQLVVRLGDFGANDLRQALLRVDIGWDLGRVLLISRVVLAHSLAALEALIRRNLLLAVERWTSRWAWRLMHCSLVGEHQLMFHLILLIVVCLINLHHLLHLFFHRLTWSLLGKFLIYHWATFALFQLRLSWFARLTWNAPLVLRIRRISGRNWLSLPQLDLLRFERCFNEVAFLGADPDQFSFCFVVLSHGLHVPLLAKHFFGSRLVELYCTVWIVHLWLQGEGPTRAMQFEPRKHRLLMLLTFVLNCRLGFSQSTNLRQLHRVVLAGDHDLILIVFPLHLDGDHRAAPTILKDWAAERGTFLHDRVLMITGGHRWDLQHIIWFFGDLC